MDVQPVEPDPVVSTELGSQFDRLAERDAELGGVAAGGLRLVGVGVDVRDDAQKHALAAARRQGGGDPVQVVAAVGDTVVLAATGAYSYTLTNNYNGARRPAIVFVAGGRDRLAVRRESWAEFLALHDVAREHDWSTVPAI